jgi:hypothetical protein
MFIKYGCLMPDARYMILDIVNRLPDIHFSNIRQRESGIWYHLISAYFFPIMIVFELMDAAPK